jgi:hypothetical protein
VPLLAAGFGPRVAPAFLAVAAFMLVGVRSLFAAAFTFFPSGHDAWVAVLQLLLASVLLAAIWAWAPRILGRGRWRTVAGICLAVLATALPPVGAIGGLGHPLVAYGFLWPGGGWAAVGGITLALAFFAHAMSRRAPAFQAGFIAMAVVGCFSWPATPTPSRGTEQYRAVNTQFPNSQLDIAARADRIGQAGRVVAALGQLGVSWILFPESTLRDLPAMDYLVDVEIARPARRHGVTVWLGANLESRGSSGTSSIVIVSPDGSRRRVDARQPMPFSLWRPWDDRSPSSSWWRTGTVTSPIGPVYVSHCYEDMVPGLFLISALRDGRPSAVVSLANNSFLGDANAVAAQAWRIDGMARLFSLPLLRAVNLPPGVN